MPRKGENIYKRKDGRWEGRYIRSYDSEHKAKYAYVYGKTYSEVKRKLTEQRGNVQKVQPTKNKSSTYGELLDCWLLHLHAKEMKDGREVDAEFQTTEALSEQEMTDAIRRSNKSSVN